MIFPQAKDFDQVKGVMKEVVLSREDIVVSMSGGGGRGALSS